MKEWLRDAKTVRVVGYDDGATYIYQRLDEHSFVCTQFNGEPIPDPEPGHYCAVEDISDNARLIEVIIPYRPNDNIRWNDNP